MSSILDDRRRTRMTEVERLEHGFLTTPEVIAWEPSSFCDGEATCDAARHQDHCRAR